MKRWIWPIGIYTLATLALTWPLASHATDSIPMGSEQSPTVPLFNLWTLGWNSSRIYLGYQGYWDAPIFYPVQGAFAFSEPQPLTGLIAAPFWTISPALAYNVVLLLFLFLNGLTVYWFLRRRGLAPVSALVAGLLALSLPFLTQERGVLHLMPIFGVFLAMDGLWSLIENPSCWAGLRLGLGVSITFLVSEQFALFLVLLVVAAIPFLHPWVRQRRLWLSLGLAVAIAAAFILPVAVPQVEALEDMAFTRSDAAVARGSAHFADYLRPSSATWQEGWFPLRLQGNHRLFPGTMLLVLAAAGVTIGLRGKRNRKWTIFLGTGLLLAFLLSLGLNLRLGDWQPYELLRGHVPGFNNMRSPFRMGYFVQVYLLLLAATFLDSLVRQKRLIAALLFAGLVFVEVISRPTRLTPVPPTIEGVAIVGPAVFLPFPDGRSTSAYADTASWMTASLPQSTSLVNGYSGYFPSLHSQLKELLADFPTTAGSTALRALGVKTILIREGWMDNEQSRRLVENMATGTIEEVASEGGFRVFRLTDSQLSPASDYVGDWALETRVEGQAIELGAYAAIQDKQMYVLAPTVAPLIWEVQLTNPEGKTTISTVSPPNAVLLYHGSDRWLRLRLPLPPGTHGLLTVTLVNHVNGRVLAERVMDLP